jgi:hypothetical protein
MRISHKYKFIFFSNPKTGSTSIRDFLNPYSDIREVQYTDRTEQNPFYAHISPKEVKEIFLIKGWNFDSYFKFTFIRNPWARLVSLYEMIKSGRSNIDEFKIWVKTIKPYGIGGGGDPYLQRWRVYGTYSIENYIKDDFGNILVDQIIRLEDINTESIKFLKKLGIPNLEKCKIPIKNNKRKYGSYLNYYDEETKEYVASIYRYDIQEFNYNFESE